MVTGSSDSGVPGLRACIPDVPSIGGRGEGIGTKVLMGKPSVLGLAEEGDLDDTYPHSLSACLSELGTMERSRARFTSVVGPVTGETCYQGGALQQAPAPGFSLIAPRFHTANLACLEYY